MNADTIWQIFRYMLMAVGGYFVNKGWVDNDSLTTIISGMGTLFVTAWGLYIKWNTKTVPADVAAKPSVTTVSPVTGAVEK